MTYDVVVVGGGIGGLTVASLLSARGISVCVLERQSQVGGCVARVQFGEHQFEPGLGMYSEWGEAEVHRRIFAELPVPAPDASVVEDELVVRLEDRTDVRIYKDQSRFFAELRRAFPECSESAVKFYEKVSRAESTDETQTFFSKAIRALRPGKTDLTNKPLLEFAGEISTRFKSFLDVQLRILVGTDLEDVAFLPASIALSIPRQNVYSIKGGPASLAECLAESISKSGGKVRLDSPVLRLAYDDNGRAIGVDLLSGETVLAKHAIVSNLTIWDTYGKLIGLNRTPADVKAKLSSLNGSGVYLLFASLEEGAVSHLPSGRMLFAPSWPSSDKGGFSFNISSELAAPAGQLSVTVCTHVEINDWFRYQSSPEDLEEWDQAALEQIWNRLHTAFPELGPDIEVIETANPRTFYDTTRRKLGMVLGSGSSSVLQSHETSLPNVFIVGDTVSTSPNVASVSESALRLADRLTPR